MQQRLQTIERLHKIGLGYNATAYMHVWYVIWKMKLIRTFSSFANTLVDYKLAAYFSYR